MANGLTSRRADSTRSSPGSGSSTSQISRPPCPACSEHCVPAGVCPRWCTPPPIATDSSPYRLASSAVAPSCPHRWLGSPARSASARLASLKPLLWPPDSETSPSRRCHHRCGWPALLTVSPSNVSRSVRCTRCSPASPNPTGRTPGEIGQALAQWPDGFVGPCEMLVVSGAR